MNKKPLVAIAVIVGILFVVIAFVYWFTKSGSLPHFFLGFVAGSTVIHIKHGLAAIIIAILLFIYAWFASAPKLPQN